MAQRQSARSVEVVPRSNARNSEVDDSFQLMHSTGKLSGFDGQGISSRVGRDSFGAQSRRAGDLR